MPALWACTAPHPSPLIALQMCAYRASQAPLLARGGPWGPAPCANRVPTAPQPTRTPAPPGDGAASWQTGLGCGRPPPLALHLQDAGAPPARFLTDPIDCPDPSQCCSPAGAYGSKYNATACELCGSGTYSTATGQASNATCAPAPPGYYANDNHTAILPCTPGSYSTGGAQSSCGPCPVGTVTDKSGAEWGGAAAGGRMHS